MCRSPKRSSSFQVFYFSFLCTCYLAMHSVWPVHLILLDIFLLNDILGSYKLCSILHCLVTSSCLHPSIFLFFMQKILIFVRAIIIGWLCVDSKICILGFGEIRLPVTQFLNLEIRFVQWISYRCFIVLNIITHQACTALNFLTRLGIKIK